MKVSRMASGDSAELIVSFQVECQIQQVLTGPHVPRFVAAGDLERMPYLVMEYIAGRTLQHWLDAPQPLEVDVISRLGVAMARAAHALHLQNTVHLDLKPQNVLFRPAPDATEPEAAKRYPSVALLAFELSHPNQVHVTKRGTNTEPKPFRTHFKR